MYLGFLDTTINEIIKLIPKSDDNTHANSSMDAIVYSSLFCVFFKDIPAGFTLKSTVLF